MPTTRMRPGTGLRARLLLLVLLAMVPALALVVQSAIDQRAASVAEIQEHAHEIANLTASEEELLFASARQMLTTLARLPAIREGGPDEFRRIGADLLRDDPRFNNIGRIDLDGNMTASVLPLTKPLNVADRSYFRRALRSGGFSIGDYQIGRLSGKSNLNFALPVRDGEGRIASVLYASLDLDWLNRHQVETLGHVPEGATLTRADHNGVVFAHYPDDPALRGKKIPVPEVLDALLRQDSGTVDATGADGVRRIHVFSRVNRSLGEGSVFVILAMPREALFAKSDRELALRLAVIGLATLLGLLAAWLGGERTLLRPIRSLLSAIRRFGEGDLSARSGIPPSAGELFELGTGFDRMAESIERRERAVLEAQQLYRTLVATSPDAVIQTDPAGIITFASPTAVAMFRGASDRDAIGKSVLEWVHPADRERAVRNVRLVLEGSQIPNNEYRMFRNDGSPFHGELNSAVLKDASGGVLGMVSIIRDVTSRKEQEEALRASSEALKSSELRLRAAIENLPFEFWACDAEGRYILANTRAIRKYGDFVGKTLEGMKTTEGFATLLDGVTRRAMSGETIRIETEFEEDGSRRWNDNILSPIRDGDAVVGLVSITIDVTERKEAEAKRQELEEQLRQSQKMEAIGQLAGGIAHDFNNLMTVVLGQVELLRRGGASDSLVHRVEEIGKAGERAASLTRQLLAFSRRQMLQPEILDLNDVVEDMRTILDRLIGENYSLDIHPGEGLWPVLADPSQIGQVVVNLVVNARDALPDGGKIEIGTRNVRLEESESAMRLPVPSGEYVLLSVRDRGTGMDEETKARLFEPFFTTKDVGKGTGLGLSTVYGIILQSGGHIDVKSTPGKGTTIDIFLPRSEETAAHPSYAVAPEDPPRGDATLLLVEDAGHVRCLVKEILEEYGYTVLEAGNGTEALQVAAAHHGPIDLLLSDVVMPEMGGRKLVEEILPLRPGIRILYMSGYAEDTAIREGAVGDNSSFLQKPFTPEALGWKVHEALSKRGA